MKPMGRKEELMSFFDEDGIDLETYYRERAIKALELKSPTQDGRGTELVTVDEMAKAALTTADVGAINAVYDLAVITNYATKNNITGAIPKKGWSRQGWRAVKTASKTSGLGVAEGGALGTAVEPVYYEIGPTPKEFEVVTDYTTRLRVLQKIADGVAVDQNRRTVESDFWRAMENDINKNFNTLAGANAESIHRITASDAERVAESYTDGDEDLYGVDRSTETWFNSNPLYAASGTDRDLQVALLNDMWEAVMPYWTSLANKFYATGPDSLMRISELEAAKVRYSMEAFKITLGDGVQVGPGIQMTGGKMATWDGFPFVVSDAVDKTDDTISPVYLMDNDYLAFQFGQPIGYQESDDMFAVGHLIRGVWYGIGELIDMFPKTCARLRDLK